MDKIRCVALIVAIIAIASVYEVEASLKCYETTAQGGIKESSNCGYCQKIVAAAGSAKSVMKGCVPSCHEVKDSVYCCKDKDLCNGATAVASFNLLVAGITSLLALWFARR